MTRLITGAIACLISTGAFAEPPLIGHIEGESYRLKEARERAEQRAQHRRKAKR